ncbi:FMN-linked oxidoreductase [Atractiella rhizophila]|nr:FMN-linked oxidoreductase [Atractiella rhizophila]
MVSSQVNTDVLFTPLDVGAGINLSHRIVLAPLTRYRANEQHVHGDLAVTYYRQRSSYPGTLLITEATFIAHEAGGFANVPGIWTKEQIAGWKKITDAVHENKSYIFCQLWAIGRQADVEQCEKEQIDFISSGDIPMVEGAKKPRALTTDEIKQFVGLYKQAALNAMEAGFDGVEIHGANGYLIDQFTQSVSNNRTDAYGGSIENRTRFAKEVTEAVVSAIGAERTAIRLSPFSHFGGMGDALPFPHLVSYLKQNHPKLAYLHLVTPRIDGDKDKSKDPTPGHHSDLMELRKIWAPSPLILAGGYLPHTAAEELKDRNDGENILIAMGRYFISNPDLPDRIKRHQDLEKYDRNTFYTHGPVGYIDYIPAEA